MFFTVSVEWHCPDPSTTIFAKGSGSPRGEGTATLGEKTEPSPASKASFKVIYLIKKTTLVYFILKFKVSVNQQNKLFPLSFLRKATQNDILFRFLEARNENPKNRLKFKFPFLTITQWG